MQIAVDTSDLVRLANSVKSFSGRRVESVIALALNRTAREIKDEWGGQLYTKIDRPTALTRGAAILGQRADIGRLSTSIALRDSVERGDPPSQYLLPQERGGGRELKQFERALIARGLMPAGARSVPGNYAELDQYGNVSRRQIVQVLNQIAGGGRLSVGYRKVVSASAARRAKAAARAGRVYVALPVPNGGLKAGIYERKGGAMLPVFFYARSVRYGKRLALMEHGLAIARVRLQTNMDRAVSESLQRLLSKTK